ncbi:hypothetical protein [Mesorhizobium sp. ANAO-SY3R2]
MPPPPRQTALGSLSPKPNLSSNSRK